MIAIVRDHFLLFCDLVCIYTNLFQICVWCWHHIIDMAEKDQSEGRCPACRTPYDKEKIVGMTVDPERLRYTPHLLSFWRFCFVVLIFSIYIYIYSCSQTEL